MFINNNFFDNIKLSMTDKIDNCEKIPNHIRRIFTMNYLGKQYVFVGNISDEFDSMIQDMVTRKNFL